MSTASDLVTTFKLGRATVLNPLVIHNALDILYRLEPIISSFVSKPALALGVFGLCIFAAFKAAKQMCDKGAPVVTPVYT